MVPKKSEETTEKRISLSLRTIAALLGPILGVVLGAEGLSFLQVKLLQQSFDSHVEASVKHEENQDKLILKSLQVGHANEVKIAELRPKVN